MLGLRTFGQQGLFFLGGALADRFGTKLGPQLALGRDGGAVWSPPR